MYPKEKEIRKPPVPKEIDDAVQVLQWCRRASGSISDAPDGALKQWLSQEIDHLLGNQPSLMEELRSKIKDLELQLQEAKADLRVASACPDTSEEDVGHNRSRGFWRGFVFSCVLWISLVVFLNVIRG